MRCKKHPADHSGAVGVCATCLRQRLIAIIAAQEKAQAQAQEDGDAARKPETKPPPLLFPRSVSPYLSHRKSDTATATAMYIRSYHSLPDPKFFSTPQIGPTGAVAPDQKRKKSKFGLLSRLFRTKSNKPVADLVPKVFEARDNEPRDSSTTSSPAWLPNFLSRKKPTQTRAFSVDDLAIRRLRRDHRDRGMSPAVDSDDEVDSEHCRPEPSGYDSDDWRQTPRRTPAASVRRRGGAATTGGRPTQLSRNVSGISFCLSPMVSANLKGGAPPEMVVSGEIRMPIKSHSITASFCKNRSRKLADIGRSSHNR